MTKFTENTGTAEIGLVTPPPPQPRNSWETHFHTYINSHHKSYIHVEIHINRHEFFNPPFIGTASQSEVPCPLTWVYTWFFCVILALRTCQQISQRTQCQLPACQIVFPLDQPTSIRLIANWWSHYQLVHTAIHPAHNKLLNRSRQRVHAKWKLKLELWSFALI